MLSVRVQNLDAVVAAIGHIPGAVEKAVKIASRKTLKAAKKEAISRVKQRYTSPIGLFTKSLQLKVTGSGGSLSSKGSKLGLNKFKTAPQGRITQRGRYIKATVVRGQGDIIKKAFRQSGNESIFERVGASRLPIKKLFSVAPPSMLNVPQVREPVLRQIEERFGTELVSAVSQFL